MTKQRKRLPLILGILCIAACLGLGGYWVFTENYAPAGENWYEKTSETLDLSGQSITDLSQLRAFPGAKQIDLRNTGLTCQEYDTVREWFPNADILWDIPFQGEFYPMDTESLTVETMSEADMAVLPYFTELKSISAGNCPDYENLHALRQQRPDLEISYRVPVRNAWHSYTVTGLTLPGDIVEELFDVLPFLTELKEVKLVQPLAPADRLLALVEAFPEVYFSWELEVGGISVNEGTETLDLTGIPMTVEEMEAALPYLPSLTYVDMTDCGISNEEMDALNSRWENVKIVWTVNLGKWFRVKTDITTFMPLKDNFYPFGDDLHNLRYCHDIIAVDIGHRKVTNCEWAAYMPHLKYLIIADTAISDITPLSGLKELVYLELFLSPIKDFSPLLTLTALEDLNLCWTYADPNIIAQMPWLKNVWWGYWEDLHLNYNVQKMLREANPDCNYCFVTRSSTGMGWRRLPNYYAQRDAFGMYYMHG